MEAKFILWSKTLWGMGALNGAVAFWNAMWPQHAIGADQLAALNMVGTLFFRSITNGPVTITPK